MRDGIRNLAEGIALAFGIVWLLLATLLLGILVAQSSSAHHLSDTLASIGVIAGGITWLGGAVLVVDYAFAVVRGRYLIALAAAAAPLVGIWIASRGPFVASARFGPVPALELDVTLASAFVAVAGGVGWALFERRHRRRSLRQTSHSHRSPPLPA